MAIGAIASADTQGARWKPTLHGPSHTYPVEPTRLPLRSETQPSTSSPPTAHRSRSTVTARVSSLATALAPASTCLHSSAPRGVRGVALPQHRRAAAHEEVETSTVVEVSPSLAVTNLTAIAGQKRSGARRLGLTATAGSPRSRCAVRGQVTQARLPVRRAPRRREPGRSGLARPPDEYDHAPRRQHRAVGHRWALARLRCAGRWLHGQ
jgi:hypothetical protein